MAGSFSVATGRSEDHLPPSGLYGVLMLSGRSTLATGQASHNREKRLIVARCRIVTYV